MNCPKCKYELEDRVECPVCGLNLDKIKDEDDLDYDKPMRFHVAWLIILCIAIIMDVNVIINNFDIGNLLIAILMAITVFFLFKRKRIGYILNMIVIGVQMLIALSFIMRGITSDYEDLAEQIPELTELNAPLIIVSGSLTIVLLILVIVYYKRRVHIFKKKDT